MTLHSLQNAAEELQRFEDMCPLVERDAFGSFGHGGVTLATTDSTIGAHRGSVGPASWGRHRPLARRQLKPRVPRPPSIEGSGRGGIARSDAAGLISLPALSHDKDQCGTEEKGQKASDPSNFD